MAKHSSDIAKASLSDSNEMRHLAADTKKIAEATRLDSAAMKTIAIVTMLFLPGTAIAVRRALPMSQHIFAETDADISIGNPQHGLILRHRSRWQACRLHSILDLLGSYDSYDHRGIYLLVVQESCRL